jgi:hypothetical protein
VALDELLAILPVVIDPKAKKEAVIKTALLNNDPELIFEKEGYVWVGRLGLKFDKNNRFVKAVTNP